MPPTRPARSGTPTPQRPARPPTAPGPNCPPAPPRELGHTDEPALTTEEWLAADQVAARAEDPHREITAEHEVADIEAQRDRDHRDTQPAAAASRNLGHSATDDAASPVEGHRAVSAEQAAEPDAAAMVDPEPAPVDIRQQAQAEHEATASTAADPGADQRRDEDTVRVPSPEETADSVRRAQRALAELRQRQEIEDRRAADEARDEQLTRWHVDDVAERGPVDDASASTEPTPHTRTAGPAESTDDEPVLERGGI